MANIHKSSVVTQFVVNDTDVPALTELSKNPDLDASPYALPSDEIDIIKAIGRIEAASFIHTVANKLIAETAIKLKEDNKYKHLKLTDINGNVRNVADFEEFCHVFLGKSYRRVMEITANYRMLSAELFEKAEEIGFKQRDYNALRALPDDDRRVITQALEADSKDTVLDLMQQLAAKHQREKEEMKKQALMLTQSADAKDAVIKKKDEKLNALDNELERLRLEKIKFAHVDWPAAFKGYMEQLAITRKNIKHGMGSLDVIRAEAMKIEPQSDAEEASITSAREILAAELVGIHNECLDMIQALGLTFDKTLGAYSEARINLLS